MPKQRMTMKWRHCVNDAPWRNGQYAVLELLPDGWRFHVAVFDKNKWMFATDLDAVLCWWAPLPQKDPIQASTANWYRHLYFNSAQSDA